MIHEVVCTKHGRRFRDELFSAHLYSGGKDQYAVVQVNAHQATANCLTVALEGRAVAYEQDLYYPKHPKYRVFRPPLEIKSPTENPKDYTQGVYKFVGQEDYNRILCVEPIYPAVRVVPIEADGEGPEYTLRISRRNRMYLHKPGDVAEPGDKFLKFKVIV